MTHTFTLICTRMHTRLHTCTPRYSRSMFMSDLSLKPSSPTKSTFISSLHLLCPQPECINCFFFYSHKIFYKTSQHFSWSVNSICFPGDSLLEPWALLTHPGLAGLDTSCIAGTPSWEFRFPCSCCIPVFADFYVFHYLGHFPYFHGDTLQLFLFGRTAQHAGS